MSESPFDWWVERLFVGTQVRAHTDDHVYEGWGRLWDEEKRRLLLYDARRDGGERLDSVTVHNPSSVETLEKGYPIEEVPVEDISPSPYSMRHTESVTEEGSLSKPASRVRVINLSENLFSYPVVRPVADGYELVSGHRRVNATRVAKLDELPVMIADLSDWEATSRFVFEHIPFESERGEEETGLYTPQQVEEALSRLRADWDDDRLRELPQLAPLLE